MTGLLVHVVTAIPLTPEKIHTETERKCEQSDALQRDPLDRRTLLPLIFHHSIFTEEETNK